MNDAQWRLLDGEGKEQGPYSTEDLRGFYSTGNINHDTMIWTEGLEEWVTAGKVEGLLPEPLQATALAAAPAPAGLTSGQQPETSSQAAGVSGKAPLPSWLGIVTLIIGVAAIVLFFLPWTSISIDQRAFGKKGEIEAFSQSGVQTITKGITLNKEFIKLPFLMLGVPEEEADKEADKMVKEAKSGKSEELPFESSTLVMSSLVLIGVGIVLALIGFINRIRTLLWISQMTYIIGAILISIQMVQQFPAVKTFIDEQKEELSQSPLMSDKEKAKAEKEITNLMQSKIEPSCYAVVGTLGISLLLLVVTLSSSGTPTVTMPQPGANTQPGQSVGFKLH